MGRSRTVDTWGAAKDTGWLSPATLPAYRRGYGACRNMMREAHNLVDGNRCRGVLS